MTAVLAIAAFGFAATAVINGNITLGAMLAIQYIVGQLNSPVEQFMNFYMLFRMLKYH